MKPHLWRRSKAGPYLRWLPRLKHVRGTWLHRRFGDRLFANEMWQPDRLRIAGGAAVGAFFAMMPFPFQMVAAAFIALVTRVNIPAAIAATWISNPFTIAFFLYAQYAVGAFLLGRPDAVFPEGGVLDILSAAPLPILIGAGVTGLIGSAMAYGMALLGWDLLAPHLLKPRENSQKRN